MEPSNLASKTETQKSKKRLSPKDILGLFGPGIVVAATGIGAADIIASSLAGTKYGLMVAWAVVFGAFIKFIVNEGIARWQLATQTTLIQGWVKHLGKPLTFVFLPYLVFWSFMVSGALINSTGMAANLIFPQLTIRHWGIIHSLITFLMVWYVSYEGFEKFMGYVTGIMFTAIIGSALLVKPELSIQNFIPQVPSGSLPFLLAVIGGVGGSVTVLNYGYWIKEKGWNQKSHLKRIKFDLASAYILTAIFGLSIVTIASYVKPESVDGNKMLVGLASNMKLVVGELGYWVFACGLWTAVYLSMRGVWQGVPLLFQDFMQSIRPIKEPKKYFRYFLIFMSFAPLSTLWTKNPVYFIMAYAITGALFMPFLAFTLLLLNNKTRLVKEFKNTLWINLGLLIALGLFIYLFADETIKQFNKYFP